MNSKLNALLEAQLDRSYALLRIMAGTMFAFHGIQKTFGFLMKSQPDVGSQMWIGGMIELIGGTVIALGIYTSVAAFLASGMMAVAYFQFHWKFQFDSQFFPGINKGELAVLYCFLFLFMACRGGGIWSLEAFLGRKQESLNESDPIETANND
jgi:putative oxidoreductase